MGWDPVSKEKYRKMREDGHKRAIEVDGVEYRNVFQIWREGGEKVPFRVRRMTWSIFRSVEITRIGDVRRTEWGIYGKAWTTDPSYDGWYGSRGAEKPGEKVVGNAGSYQWVLVVK